MNRRLFSSSLLRWLLLSRRVVLSWFCFVWALQSVSVCKLSKQITIKLKLMWMKRNMNGTNHGRTGGRSALNREYKYLRSIQQINEANSSRLSWSFSCQTLHRRTPGIMDLIMAKDQLCCGSWGEGERARRHQSNSSSSNHNHIFACLCFCLFRWSHSGPSPFEKIKINAKFFSWNRTKNFAINMPMYN